MYSAFLPPQLGDSSVQFNPYPARGEGNTPYLQTSEEPPPALVRHRHLQPLLLSSSAEGWRSSLFRKTSWVPELRSRTTSAIHLYLHNYPSSGLRPPSPARGEGKKPYLQTSRPLYLRNSFPTLTLS